MGLHKETVVKVDLPNGVQAELPSFCGDAVTVEIVKVAGKDGDEFVVGLKVPDIDSSGVDPRENDAGFGEFKEFQTTEKMDDFLRAHCEEDYQTAAEQAGWKLKEDGRLAIDGDIVDVADDWEEACEISEVPPILVPEKLMFMVDKYEHGLVMYKATDDDVGLDSNAAGVFIPCEDVQDRYKKQLAAGVPIKEARADALADTNKTLDGFTAWCNGEVYGVLDYRFDAEGESLDNGEEVWGFIGSEYADKELASRLFGPRVQAKAAELGLDADKQQNVNRNSGQYVGQVLDVDKAVGLMFIDAGCGNWNAHSLAGFEQVPEVGQKIDIKYNAGQPSLNGPKQSVEKDLGR